jgi:hypothetical protein
MARARAKRNNTRKHSRKSYRFEQSLAEFESFTVDHWVRWLSDFFDNENQPEVAFGTEELDLSLIAMYDELTPKSTRTRFGRAVALLFESTPLISPNAEQIYYLIQLLCYMKPPEAKRVLRRHLSEEVLSGKCYAGHDLHTMLLVACSMYDVDDDLVAYIERSVATINDFSYLLVCQRVLCLREGRGGYSFIGRLLNRMDSESEAARLTRHLEFVAVTEGYRRLYNWYTENESRLAKEMPDKWQLFEAALKRRLMPYADKDQDVSQEPYASLLAMRLNGHDNLSDLPDLVEKLSKSVDSPTVEHAVASARKKKPWYIGGPEIVPFNRVLKNDHFGILDDGVKHHFFDTQKYPEASRIFYSVENNLSRTIH